MDTQKMLDLMLQLLKYLLSERIFNSVGIFGNWTSEGELCPFVWKHLGEVHLFFVPFTLLVFVKDQDIFFMQVHGMDCYCPSSSFHTYS